MKKIILSLLLTLPAFSFAAKDVTIRIKVEKGDQKAFAGSKIINLKQIDGQDVERGELITSDENVDSYLSQLEDGAEYTCNARLGMIRAEGALKARYMVKVSNVFSISNCK